MSLIEIFAILFIHWVADFVMQRDEIAKSKSKSIVVLNIHSLEYIAVWFLPLFYYSMTIEEPYKLLSFIGFMIITYVSHFITDYYTSRLNARLWKKGKSHRFFVSVGFDQLLHYGQLFLTFYYCFK
jgi:hypothetical protein